MNGPTGMNQDKPISPVLRAHLSALAALIIALMGLTAICGLLLLVLNPRTETLGRLTGSFGMLTPYVGLAFISTNTLRRRRLHLLAAGTVIGGAIAAAGWLALIWRVEDLRSRDVETCLKMASAGSVIAIACVHAAQMACLKIKSTLLDIARWLVTAAFALAAGLGVMLIIAGDAIYRSLGDEGMMMISLFWGLDACVGLLGSLVVPTIIWTVNRRERARAESVAQRVRLDFECPQCGSEQSLLSGAASCAACGFAMVIEVEEPRCECGYLLYRLEGNRCPECGREIRPPSPPAPPAPPIAPSGGDQPQGPASAAA